MQGKRFVFKLVRKIGRLFYGKNVLLISDRPHEADDNGEALYKYLISHNINAVFAIQKESADYKRLSKTGKVIGYDTFLHKFLLCTCDAHISSHLTHMENHTETPQIFLQHGVCSNDISAYINSSSHNNFYIITTLKTEKSSISKPPYKVIPSHVLLTGAPRYDYLYNNPQKIITISFTWRPNLYYTGEDEFIQSQYFKKYNEILSDEAFLQEIHKYGYTVYLKLHPAMQKFINCFQTFSSIKIWDEKYRDIFAKSDLLVSDYSSIVYDFAYLKKPVIYYQSDYASFWENSLFDKGQMDYENDGLGDVIYDYSSLKSTILEYVKNNCEIKDIYIKKIESLFVYQDQNNCARVYEEIQKIIT